MSLFRSILAAVAIITTVSNPALASSRISGDAKSRVSKPIIHEPRQTGPDDFKIAITIVLKKMMASYTSAVKKPITIEVMDTSVAEVHKFFGAMSEKSYDPHIILALNYVDKAKINGNRTSACLVQYNSANRNKLLAGYENSRIYNKQDILYYLAAHEFGHCMAFHQFAISRDSRIKYSKKGHELLADKVAVAFFLVNGKFESARRSVDFNKVMVDDHLHYHPEELSEFHDKLKKYLTSNNPREKVKTMLDIYQIASGAVDISS